MLWLFFFTALSGDSTRADILLPQYEITLDQTTHIIGSARDVIVIPGEEIIVCDSKDPSVKIFSPSGDLRDVLGRKGEGPGEFAVPIAIAVTDHQLYVMDIMLARTAVFDRDSHTFLKNIKTLDGMEIEVVSDRIYISAPHIENNTSLHIFDLTGTLLKSTCPIPAITLANKAVSSNISFDIAADGTIYLVHEMEHDIQVMGPEGEFKKTLKGSLRGYQPAPLKPFTDFHLRQKATAWIKSWTHVSKIEVLNKSGRLLVAKTDFDPTRYYLDFYDREGSLRLGPVRVDMRLLYVDSDENLYFQTLSEKDDVIISSYRLADF